MECILEYNRFEGGSRDVTDGGMIHTGGARFRNNHYRYNLFHMFSATHNAIYNDTMTSGNYMYGNVVSTLNSASDHNKPWYSSTGWGNIAYGNICFLRNPIEIREADSSASAESDPTVFASPISGDLLNESALFYYYFGNEYVDYANRLYQPVDLTGAPQKDYTVAADGTVTFTKQPTLTRSLAGHWWTGHKDEDVTYFLSTADLAHWKARSPEFINMLYGTEMILEVYESAAFSDTDAMDYHIRHFYMPWYLCGKDYTFRHVPVGTVITVPQYQYLTPIEGETKKATLVTVPERTFTVEGEFTLSYEEIAAMERARRSPSYSVVMNNVLLGGTPIYQTVKGELTIPEDAVPDREKLITDSAVGYRGYRPTSLKTHNFMAYRYDDIAPYTDFFDYAIEEEGWEIIGAAGLEDPTLAPQASAMEELRDAANHYINAGPTYHFPYWDWFDDVYPDFYD